jgi:uncharacterized protein
VRRLNGLAALILAHFIPAPLTERRRAGLPSKETATDASTVFVRRLADPLSTAGRFQGPVPCGGRRIRQREREFKGDANTGFLGSTPPYLPLRARQDMLVFQTEPLAMDTELVGPIVVKLFAASTAPDTDFTAKLVDVYPPSKD